ncbi:DUF2267 domain-containing protein [Arthrobacter castelli]|uniref:DUF2267 domain-containing protein n=1 Tax=Arthrobacter castelli TaxID=271431 RepID=UPI00041A2F4B|nr:DUF2267 domain-containing protein [Arthrobacter castelli]
MQTEEFMDQVQQRAELADRGQATKVTDAVLSVFGQLQLKGETNDVIAQLPREVAEMVSRPSQPEQFDADEFIARIQTELSCSAAQADRAATAVLSTTSEAVIDGEKIDLLLQLPKDFSRFATAD